MLIPTHKKYLFQPKKHPSRKKSCGEDLKKGDEKDVKLKGAGQSLCRNAVDHIKNFDNDDLSHKTFLPQCFAT